MSAYSFLNNYTVDELKKFIDEQRPICDKKQQEAYNAPDVNEFERLYTEASEPIIIAKQLLNTKLKKDKIEMKPHSKHGDLILLEDFVESCKNGWFIDYDGSGNYATENKQTDITICPSDVIDGKYRKDFTHVMWYNR